MAKTFNIVRFKRIKHTGQLTNAASHNFRVHKNISNVDYSKTNENIYLVGNQNTNLKQEFDSLREKYKFKYIKDNFNMYDEFVISASPDFFQGMSKKQQIQYFKDNIDILQKHFFKVKGSIVSAVIHFDESTPHCHVMACPIVCENQKTIARGKDKGKIITGEFYSLSHDKILGKRQQCRDLQTIFHKELILKDWKVDRGRQNTGIKHQELKEYNRAIQDFKNLQESEIKLHKELKNFDNLSTVQKLTKIPRMIELIKTSIERLKVNYNNMKAVFVKNTKLEKQNDELKERLDKQATTRAELKQKFDTQLSKFKDAAMVEINKLRQAEQGFKQQISRLKQENKQLQEDVLEEKEKIELFEDIINSNTELLNLYNKTVDDLFEDENTPENAPKTNFKRGFQP